MMARYYHREDKIQEICEWYDGYRFGITEIFNPWSVINYFHNACEAKAYWAVSYTHLPAAGRSVQTDGQFYYRQFSFLCHDKVFSDEKQFVGSDHDRNHRLRAGAGHHDAVSASGPADVGILGDSGIKLFFLPV